MAFKVGVAPILCGGVTTYKALKETEARPGEWVAISGIGGLGPVAVQYAKATGLHVAALDVGEDKLDLARHLGAEIVVDARHPNAVAEIVRLSGGGVHGVVVTAVSPPAFRQALDLVRHSYEGAAPLDLIVSTLLLRIGPEQGPQKPAQNDQYARSGRAADSGIAWPDHIFGPIKRMVDAGATIHFSFPRQTIFFECRIDLYASFRCRR